jgi:curved DNA-binding protein CbpA
MADPYLTLGIAPDADDAAVEAAYREAIKRSPPERDPAGFQAAREAYEGLRTERDRVAHALFDQEPPTPLDLFRRALMPSDDAGADAGQCRPAPALFKALLRGED